MRTGGAPPQNVTPAHIGGMNAVAGHPMPTLINHATGGPPFSNNATMKPHHFGLGASDMSNLSAAEVYCQEHEVNATVCS